MTDPTIIDVIRRTREQLIAREAETVRTLVEWWGEVARALDAEIQALAFEAQAEGTLTQAQLFQLRRYQLLLDQARGEIDRYTARAAALIDAQRRAAVVLGVGGAEDAIRTLLTDAGRLDVLFSTLPVNAVETLVGMLAQGSPLRELLASTWPDAVDGLTRALLRGLGLGRNPRVVARLIVEGFDLGLNRALVIARTEMLRAYREGTRRQYEESGVVSGYLRLATHDGRVCLGCLLAEGMVFETREAFDEHPNGRCTLVPVVRGVPPPQWLAGEAWLRAQSPERQEEILGRTRYEMWRSGRAELSDFLKHTHNAEWGGAFVPRPLKELTPAA